MKTGITILALMTIAVLPDWVMGQKLDLKVVLTIEEPDYVDYYSATELQTACKTGAASIAKVLNKQMPFFNFTSSGNAGDSLMLKITRRPNGSTFMFFVDWKAKIIGKHVPQSRDHHTWLFLNAENYASVLHDDPVEFGNAIAAVLENQLKVDFNQKDYINNIFSYIKITDKAESIDLNNRKWVLPFTYNSINVGLDSQFKVDNLFNQVEHKDFKCSVIGEPTENGKILVKSEDGLGDYTLNQFTRLDGIYIIYYHPLNDVNDDF